HRAHPRGAALRPQVRIRNGAPRAPHARDRALRRHGRAARAGAARGRRGRRLRTATALLRCTGRAGHQNRAMRTERRRRFRGTVFVSRREVHEHLTVAVTPLEGPVGGPAFVLVHGIGVSSRYFRPLALELVRHGSVYLIDLPGYGAAPDPRTEVTLDGHADAVASLLRGLTARETVVVGHSMGAQVVVSLARRHPPLVSRLVLLGPTMEPGRRTAVQARSEEH